MSKITKRFKTLLEKVDSSKDYVLDEAITTVKTLASAKFDETVEIALSLNVDPRHADQMVRGSVVLPAGTGKKVRVAVVAKDAKADEAKAAGADIVGAEDFIDEIAKGEINFDVLIATPNLMGVLGKVARTLGPKGLMPNPKSGTVTMDVKKAINDVKAGKVEYRLDKTNNIHVGIGKASFGKEKLVENLNTILQAVIKAKPAAAKGQYIKNATIASSMGPGVKLAVRG